MNKVINFKVLYIAIVLFYCIFLSQFGYELWDTGYINSFSWRILNNEVIYTDFIYKGPPITLYFHAIFMKILPEVGQIYWTRILCYILFAIQVFFIVEGFYNLYKLKFNKYAVMIICFIISFLNFPAYPWPTTDGLFFMSIAFYIATLKKTNVTISILLVALFSTISAFTKQSFYPIPILFSVWMFINYGKKISLLYFISFIGFTSFLLFLIFNFSSIDLFIEQTTGETTFFQLLYSGFLVYFWYYDYKWLYYIAILIIALFIYIFQPKKKIKSIKYFINSLGLSILLFALFLIFFKEILIASRLVFIGLFLLLVYQFSFTIDFLKKYSTILLFLGVAWCSSISLGYAFPILFSTGMILSLLFIFEENILKISQKKVLNSLVLLITLIAFSYTFYPYREENLSKLKYSLEEVSPKLKFIKSTYSNKQKLIELKQLVNKYNKNYLVAPNIPMAHYLFNTQSKLPADWIINTEINKNPKIFIDIAKKNDNFIFLEKSFINGETLMPPKRESFSLIADYIYRNFKKIDETKYFIIYNTQLTNERIPEIN